MYMYMYMCNHTCMYVYMQVCIELNIFSLVISNISPCRKAAGQTGIRYTPGARLSVGLLIQLKHPCLHFPMENHHCRVSQANV